MINIIVPYHLQELNLEMNHDQYHNSDYDKAKEDFYTLNACCFRTIYFSLAPLLCVSMYQQIRPQHDIYGYDMQRHSAFWVIGHSSCIYYCNFTRLLSFVSLIRHHLSPFVTPFVTRFRVFNYLIFSY